MGNTLKSTKNQKNCPDKMPDQISKCPDIRYFWSENVQCLNVISGSVDISM